jgi:hypothetical protein
MGFFLTLRAYVGAIPQIGPQSHSSTLYTVINIDHGVKKTVSEQNGMKIMKVLVTSVGSGVQN